MSAKITILTPTYNRADKLENLFASLLSQTNKNFDWLVVDDGSADGTREVVESFKQRANFPVNYIYKKNGGKHTALNVGIAAISALLTFIVDSDDTLTDDAVQTVIDSQEKYKDLENICGFAFLRKFTDGKINGEQFKPDGKIGTYIDVRINSGDIFADKAEVFYTETLKKYPFPEFEGERFLGEDVVWIRIALDYSMVHINRAIYIGEYLSDGLTSGRRLNNIRSPRGCVLRAREFMRKQIKFKYRLKGTVQYIVYGKFAGYKYGRLMKESPKKFLTFLCYPASLIIYRKWKKSAKV